MIVRTVLDLNKKMPEVIVDMRDCNAMHRRVMSMFYHVRFDRVAHHILYRIDDADDDHARLLMHSNVLPDVSVVPLRYTRANPASDAFFGGRLRTVQPGDRYRFRLCTMPSKRIAQSGKRIPIAHIAEQHAWLVRKGGDHGFALDTQPHIHASGVVYGYRGVNHAPMRYVTTTFEGVLTVTDVDALYTAVQQGIGTGKAHGLGLLEVRIDD